MFFDEGSLSQSWVVFQLENQRYAISAQLVREMAIIENPVKIPSAPDFVRGVINRRGAILPVLDLRTWLGLPSQREVTQNLIREMQRREQDHREWLSDLEACIKEHRPFTKEIDPHKCAFGKWYDAFSTDNVFVRAIIREFDEPHKAIHAIAAKAMKVADQGNKKEAQDIIQKTRETDLKRMIELFGRFREDLEKSLRDTVIVIKRNESSAALVVDRIESVERLGEKYDSTETIQSVGHETPIPLIGRRIKDDTPVLLPDVDLLLSAIHGSLHHSDLPLGDDYSSTG